MKRVVCIVLSEVLLFLTASCGKSPTPSEPSPQKAQTQPVYTAKPARWSKQEAVFVSLSADGAPTQIRVTDRIRTDIPQVRVDDVSALRNIRDLKGGLIPQTNGVTLAWHMPTTELYYTGESDKALPVDVHITYALNGKAVDAETLQGKSGVVSVRVQAVNHHRQGEVYTPFLLAGGMLLPQDAADVTLEHGGSFGDGNRDLAFGVLLPGMAQNLGLTDTDLLPDSFSVSFQTSRYRQPEMYFLLLPLSTLQLGDALSSVFGASDLPQFDLSAMTKELRQFDAATLTQLIRQLPQSSSLLQTASQAMTAYEAEQPLLDVLQTYLTAENAQLLSETIDSLSGTSLKEYAALLKEPAFIALLADMSTVSAAFSRLIPVLSSMIDALNTPQVRAAIQKLPDTMEKLNALSAAVEQNGQLLRTLTDFSESGAMGQLTALFSSVQTTLDSGALDTLLSLSGRAQELQNRLQATLEAGKKYGIFTDAPQDAETSVYFVLKVDHL